MPTTVDLGDITLTYTVTNSWNGGYLGEIRLHNDTAAALTGWSFRIEGDLSIVNLWRADVVPDGPGAYIVSAPSWAQTLQPGQTFDLGFQAGGSSSAPLTFEDGDEGGDPGEPAELPVLSVAGVDGAEAGSPVKFTLSLSEASATPVTVHVATENGTALSGQDYAAVSTTVTFAPGETSRTIEVGVLDDSLLEGRETLSLRLTAPGGATIGTATATAGIVSNDLPSLGIGNASVLEGDPGSGGSLTFLSTEGNQIVDAAGNEVMLAGVNWFGMETGNASPHGLWARNYKDMMDQMVDLGFNTIRLPFANEALNPGHMPSGIDYGLNPDLEGLTSLQVLDRIVDYAGEIGLRIMLDNHRSTLGGGPEGNGLWYTGAYPESRWISDWEMLAERYAGNPTVIGADLRNEPHGATWNDWAAAAERAGNAIHDANPDWLIFVEGVATHNGDAYWWGGNLQGATARPVDLDVDGKLVYSPHDYSPDVYNQPWFSDPSFPANLPAKFDTNWGYLYQQEIAPVLVGEFGTRYADARNQAWLDAFVKYLDGDFDLDGTRDIPAGDKGVSWTYWSWNPNSGDTGGILSDDWTTPIQAKLDALEASLEDATRFDGGGGTAPRYADVQLTLSQAFATSVGFDWSTRNGTATAGQDYVADSGVVTFAAGETTKTLRVEITPDNADESDETFFVDLVARQGGVAGGTATVTIRDDDGTPDEPEEPDEPDEPDEPGELDVAIDIAVPQKSQWWYQVDVAITNNGDEALGDWELELPFLAPIAQIWNAQATQGGGTAEFTTQTSWGMVISPGETVSFGFGGNPNGTSLAAIDAALLESQAAFTASIVG